MAKKRRPAEEIYACAMARAYKRGKVSAASFKAALVAAEAAAKARREAAKTPEALAARAAARAYAQGRVSAATMLAAEAAARAAAEKPSY